ncbi:MAG: hypothetical protein FJW34_00765 [Acidobacteria bacterium]|nr:hypothetical protein [Acidobacteriota bacterium]
MKALPSFFLVCTFGVALVAVPTLSAVDYNCVPLEVALLENRAHVLCAEPAPKTRGSFPVDTGHAIRYFAVPYTDTQWAERFIRLSNIAITSGLVIRFSFTSGDYSGESFGCVRDNCRKPWAFALLRTAVVP